jgi:hypothetical protein
LRIPHAGCANGLNKKKKKERKEEEEKKQDIWAVVPYRISKLSYVTNSNVCGRGKPYFPPNV